MSEYSEVEQPFLEQLAGLSWTVIDQGGGIPRTKELDLTEGRSTGIPKILRAMAANGSPAPRFETDDDRLAYVIRLPSHPLTKRPNPELTDQVTDQVTGEVGRLLMVALRGELARSALQAALGLKHTPHFREAYLLPALEHGLMEMTLPEKPNSRSQRYRLTEKGRQWLQSRADRNPT